MTLTMRPDKVFRSTLTHRPVAQDDVVVADVLPSLCDVHLPNLSHREIVSLRRCRAMDDNLVRPFSFFDARWNRPLRVSPSDWTFFTILAQSCHSLIFCFFINIFHFT